MRGEVIRVIHELSPEFEALKVCAISGCGSTYRMRRGLCNLHYVRQLRHGDAHVSKHRRGSGNTLAEKFWSRVNKGTPDECWEWVGARYSTGYGMASFDQKTIPAHRLAYFYFTKEMPSKMVLHSCDNKICVNPAHLRQGSHADNMQDKHDRNRIARGTSLPQAKLTEQDVREIRNLLQKQITQETIARQFGVHQSTVSDIKRGKLWGWVNYQGEV